MEYAVKMHHGINDKSKGISINCINVNFKRTNRIPLMQHEETNRMPVEYQYKEG